jgi:hypothetical protein
MHCCRHYVSVRCDKGAYSVPRHFEISMCALEPAVLWRYYSTRYTTTTMIQYFVLDADGQCACAICCCCCCCYCCCCCCCCFRHRLRRCHEYYIHCRYRCTRSNDTHRHRMRFARSGSKKDLAPSHEACQFACCTSRHRLPYRLRSTSTLKPSLLLGARVYRLHCQRSPNPMPMVSSKKVAMRRLRA